MQVADLGWIWGSGWSQGARSTSGTTHVEIRAGGGTEEVGSSGTDQRPSPFGLAPGVPSDDTSDEVETRRESQTA